MLLERLLPTCIRQKIGPKKVALFLDIGRVKIFLSLTRPHSRMCIKIYIFNFKKQTNNQKNQKQKKTRFQKKEKETEEEKRIFPEDRLKKKICGQEYFFFGLA